MDQFKIAILQLRSESHDPQKNTETVIQAMAEASRQGADLLLTPECFLTGYVLPAENEDALPPQNKYLDRLCQAASQYRIGLIVTALVRGNSRPHNRAWVINKNGERLMHYDKVHTCAFSLEACLEPGTEFKVCDFHGVKLGVMICYDREYPESARILMLKGAEIILVPNDCGSMKPRLQALSTRAYENMTAVFMANPPGENAGHSCGYSPICWDSEGQCVDNTLLEAGELDEGLFYASLDLNALRHYRKHEMMGNTFRRCSAYAELMNPEIKEPFFREGQDQ